MLQLVGLHKAWSHIPLHRSTAGPSSPDWACSSYPGSPLLHKRANRVMTPLTVGGDGSPLGSACPSPLRLESETERLNRWEWSSERLRVKRKKLSYHALYTCMERRLDTDTGFIIIIPDASRSWRPETNVSLLLWSERRASRSRSVSR